MTTPAFDWSVPWTAGHEHKMAFHRNAQLRLRMLAKELGLGPKAFEIRTNKGGSASCGEVVLVSDRIFVQATQDTGGPERGVMFRSSRSREDMRGGEHHFAPLSRLDDLPDLARTIRETLCPAPAAAPRA